MKTIWKWILGGLAALLVIGALVLPFLMHLFLPFGGYGFTANRFGYGGMPMHGGFGYMPMMGGFGFGFGAIFGGLIQLGVLVLIVLGIIWLVRAIGRQNTPKSN